MADIEALEKKWENRKSWMLSYAEKYHYEGNEEGQRHFEACARQWQSALDELREFFVGIAQR